MKLLAAQNFAKKHNKEPVPVVVANTFTYKHMPQARRFSYSNDAVAGFLAHMGNLRALNNFSSRGSALAPRY